jgi:hypothetical protein
VERYPDDALARFLLDRSKQVEASGIDYREYRAVLREAEEALERSDFDHARDACARAAALWPSDEEWRAVDGRIAGRRDAEIAEAITRAEQLLRAAESEASDPEGSLPHVPAVLEHVAHAERLGAPEEWTRPLADEARRLEADLNERIVARESEARARSERRARIREEALSHGRALIARAQEAMREPGGNAEDALYLYEMAREELVRALHEQPDDEESNRLAGHVEESIEALSTKVEEQRAKVSEVRRTMRAVRTALEAARRLADGDVRQLEGGLRRLDDVDGWLSQLRQIVPDDADAADARSEADHLRRTIGRRRDREIRRATELDAALSAGNEALGEARVLAARGIEEADRAERCCANALRHFARALILDESNQEASDGRVEAETLHEYLRSERRRHDTDRQPSVQGGGAAMDPG